MYIKELLKETVAIKYFCYAPYDDIIRFIVAGQCYHGTEGDADGIEVLGSSVDPHLKHKKKGK